MTRIPAIQMMHPAPGRLTDSLAPTIVTAFAWDIPPRRGGCSSYGWTADQPLEDDEYVERRDRFGHTANRLQTRDALGNGNLLGLAASLSAP